MPPSPLSASQRRGWNLPYSNFHDSAFGAILGEPVGPRGWLGVSIGFVGVLVLLSPGTDSFSPWGLLPNVGAAFYACGQMLTRLKFQDISAPVPSVFL
jgi:drug/metabolite transporter (DMT)-like permease